MLPAVILAGGASSRMGTPKALLRAPDGPPFIGRVVRTLAAAGLRDLIVVTGVEHERIVAAVESDATVRPRFVRNPDPSRGQLSSLWCGLDVAETPATEGLLMTLVDVPMISLSTVTAVVTRWRETRAPIVRPLYNGRRGHPVVFDRAVFDELRQAPLEEGARVVIHAHRQDAIDVQVDDPGCLVDVDTQADYNRLQVAPDRQSGE